ncbi:kinase-like domain-containing protein [Stachybotrys elegans]|uniref:Kinase-like domain-containing protein n=1 Tax=Stachybotrys elegans TaxID=80388 RepID=A0A8K0SG16_9HYPO|nr:kinase-like domain-containing protein [Stachybotrys elegans]
MAARPVRESIQEIDDNSWLIGNKVLLSRAPLSQCTWEDGNGGGYLISDATIPLPETRPLSDASDIKLVYDAGGVSAVFIVGEAFCKVRVLDVPRVTREHVTLEWLHRRTWSFAIPKVLHYTEHDGRYYIILSRVPGQTLDSLWVNLSEPMRHHYAERVVDICKELAVPADRSSISGVDGNTLSERYLCGRKVDCSPHNLRKACQELTMDCSALVFYHCDLGPSNILVDPANGSIGIIDWETAGFVPVEWIMTKFRVSSGMNLSNGDELDWRRRVINRMRELGFTDVVEHFVRWGK